MHKWTAHARRRRRRPPQKVSACSFRDDRGRRPAGARCRHVPKQQNPKSSKSGKGAVLEVDAGAEPKGLRVRASRDVPRNAIACQSSDACRKSSIKRAAATSLSESLARAELFPVDCLQSLYKVTLWRPLSARKYLIARLLGVDGDRTVPLRSSRAPHYAYIHTQTHAA